MMIALYILAALGGLIVLSLTVLVVAFWVQDRRDERAWKNRWKSDYPGDGR